MPRRLNLPADRDLLGIGLLPVRRLDDNRPDVMTDAGALTADRCSWEVALSVVGTIGSTVGVNPKGWAGVAWLDGAPGGLGRLWRTSWYSTLAGPAERDLLGHVVC
jgi:hypothetical protein